MAANVTAIAEALRDCLCTALEAEPLSGPVCQCCIRPGMAPPAADNCCDCGTGQGQASVQIAEIYPSDKFPRKGIAEWKGACTKGNTFWVAELVMTVYRCVPVPGEDGQPPDCDELQTAAARIWSDAQVMTQVFACCDWADGRHVLPGSWQPLPNQGGCGGGMMSVYVNLGVQCCPAVP